MPVGSDIRDVCIRDVRILDPHSQTDTIGCVLVRDGILTHLGPGSAGEIPENALEIEGKGLWLTPGWVDIHTHFREPGQEWKEDIVSGSRAAARAGVVAAVCMANTTPSNDHPSITRAMIERARNTGLIDLYPLGAASVGLKQEALSPMVQLKEAGVVGFSDDGLVIQNGQFMRRVMEYARTLDLPVIPHAEDLYIRQDGVMHEGQVSWDLGYRGNPRAAEAAMIARDIEISAITGCHLHIPHVTTKEGAELIRRAKDRGLHVTAEVCPHHFALTDEAVRAYGTNAKMAPPLREDEDRRALIDGLLDGTFDCIATDHAPHAVHEKELPFDQAPFGILGFQTLLPITLTLRQQVSIPDLKLVELVTLAPSRVINLPHGLLQTGEPASLTLVDPEKAWVLDESENESKSKNSPWWGQELTGKAVLTMHNGTVSWQEPT